MPQPGTLQNSPPVWTSPFRPIAPNPILPQALRINTNEKHAWELPAIENTPKPTRPYQANDCNEAFHQEGSVSDSSVHSQSFAVDQRKRRREQNRTAQRAFRARKEVYVKELEEKIKAIETAHAFHIDRLERENGELRSAMREMQLRLQATESNTEPLGLVLGSGHETPPTLSSVHKEVQLQRASSSAIACIRDKDGISFCERLKKEVCNSAYNQLLSEPLFDATGLLNDTVTQHRVPIVTGRMTVDNETDDIVKSAKKLFDKFAQTITERLENTPRQESSLRARLIPCSQVWKRLSNHPSFEEFDLDEVFDKLKQFAMCSETGPMFEEEEIQRVLEIVEKKVS
ncbi:hypothetical protein BDF14DRAFT_1809925 [Spinellus fusiger]|nr:hypothetical protein BDF14DRAFT_1859126 [Spinellus fusiger]KAI7866778.1 hypothetical protein BDF14DRAFT_1809925 [Spinellus fusiger]